MISKEQPFSWELFRKAAAGELSGDEAVELNQWLSENSRNRKYFDRARGFYSKNDPDINLQDEDYLPAYRDFVKYTRRKDRKRLLSRLQVAAAIVILVTSTMVVLIQLRKIPGSDLAQVENIDITPGRSIALLTINNGKSFRLEHQDTIITVGNESKEEYLSIGSGRIEYRSDINSQAATPVLNRIEIPHGGEYRVTLPDGSELFVNSETVVEYYVPFRDGKRELRVSGEVYLEVAKDSSLPFIVSTDDYSVRVLGTKFNVCAYPDDGFAATTLVSGSVEILGIKNHEGSNFLLEPSQQLFLDKSSYSPEILSVEPEIYTAWTKGFFVFEEETLYSIFRKLERWYDIKVFFFSEEAEHELFSGKLPRFENLQDILSIINKVSTAKLELNGSTVVIE